MDSYNMRIFKMLFSVLGLSMLWNLDSISAAGVHQHSKRSFLQSDPGYLNNTVGDMVERSLYAVDDNFTVYPESFLDGEDVTVQWKNKPNPEKKDFLGLSCGEKSGEYDFLDKVKVGNVTDVGNYTFSGFINMRCNYTIGYYEVQGDSQKKTSEVEVSPRKGFHEPMHIHIALTNDPSKISVMWTSANNNQPQVKLWTLRDLMHNEWSWNNIEKIFNGTIKGNYPKNLMCGSPANVLNQEYYRNPGYQKTVILSGLERGGYYYSVGDDENGWTEKLLLLVGPHQTHNTYFLAYGDLGIDAAPAGQGTIDRMLEEEGNDFILHFGDVSYARGKGWIWERFFRMIEPIASYTPYMVSVGNHEYDHTGQPHKDPSGVKDGGFHPLWGNYGDDSAGECGVPMYYRFDMPKNGNSVFWYSFDHGLVHVIQFSTEHDYTYESEQYKWLEEDLKKVDRTKTPYVVVTGHRPMYTSEKPYMSDFMVSKGDARSIGRFILYI